MELENIIQKLDKMFVPTSIIRYYGSDTLKIAERDIRYMVQYGLLGAEVIRVGTYIAIPILIYKAFFQ